MYRIQPFHTKNAIVFCFCFLWAQQPIGTGVLKSGGVRALAQTNVRLGSGLAEHMAWAEEVRINIFFSTPSKQNSLKYLQHQPLFGVSISTEGGGD